MYLLCELKYYSSSPSIYTIGRSFTAAQRVKQSMIECLPHSVFVPNEHPHCKSNADFEGIVDGRSFFDEDLPVGQLGRDSLFLSVDDFLLVFNILC